MRTYQVEVLLAVGESLLLVVLVAHEGLLANGADEVLNVQVRRAEREDWGTLLTN